MARRFLSAFAFSSLLSCLSLCALPAHGQLAFSALASYPTGQNPQYVAAGDLNGDGAPDVVVVNTSSNSISVLINKKDGTGTYKAPVAYPVGTGPAWAAIADLNGDSKADIAVCNATTGNVSVLLGVGDGSLQAGTFSSVVAAGTAGIPTPSALAVGDVNQDGNLDIVVSNSGLSTVSVLTGNGKGSFIATASVAVGSAPDSVALADFTGSGHLDIVTANRTGRNVSVCLGNGNGTFQAAKNTAAGYVPYSVSVGDFNGDGKPDVVVADNIAGGVNLLKGNGDGTFQKAVLFAGGKNPIAIGVGDFNGDGEPDVATINNGTQDVSAFVNEGATFAPAISLAPALTHLGIAVTDVDCDGNMDLVLANAPSGVSVLLNVTANLTQLLLAPNTVLTGNSTVATLKLSRTAPAGGVLADLTSSNPNLAWVPANVLIPAGATSANFHISTSSPLSGTAVITASYAGVTVTDNLYVNPLPPGSLKSDVNGDGKVDVMDIVAIARIVGGLDPMK